MPYRADIISPVGVKQFAGVTPKDLPRCFEVDLAGCGDVLAGDGRGVTGGSDVAGKLFGVVEQAIATANSLG